MNIGLTGATGFIGRRILDLALRRGHEIIAFTRRPENRIPGCTMRPFSLDAVPDISGCDAIIHLAGESIAGLWTAAKKRRISESRVLGTRRLVEAINASGQPPEVLICASGTGIYGEKGEEEVTEASPLGEGFLADIARQWEAEALVAENCRVVLLRTAMVLGKGSGALAVLAPLFRACLGGPISSGRQWMPWIHLEDQAMLALFVMEDLEIRGPVNACAPWPVRNAEFTSALSAVLRRPAVWRVPAFALRPLREFSSELLESRRVVPGVATSHGFRFRFAELEPALKDLLT